MPADLSIEIKDLMERLQRSERWHYREKIALLEALQAQFGPGVLEVVDRVTAERATRYGQIVARGSEDHSLLAFVRVFWEPERRQGLEFTMDWQATGVQMRCTRCPVYELARELNATEWFHRLVCAADPYVAAGFNPQLRLRRTTTLMQGHDSCDHFYFVEGEGAEVARQ